MSERCFLSFFLLKRGRFSRSMGRLSAPCVFVLAGIEVLCGIPSSMGTVSTKILVPVLYAQAATWNELPGWLKQQKSVFSQLQKSKVKLLAGLVSGEACLFGSQTQPPSCCVLHGPFSVCVTPVFSSWIRTQVLFD